MMDTLSPRERSERMRLVKSRDTRPELFVRKLCRELGFKGYRLHRKDLPGKPDMAFFRQKAVIFVHGCFWHGHDCKNGNRQPKDNADYWAKKVSRNKECDAQSQETLRALGWRILVIWECQLKNRKALGDRIMEFLGR